VINYARKVFALGMVVAGVMGCTFGALDGVSGSAMLVLVAITVAAARLAYLEWGVGE